MIRVIVLRTAGTNCDDETAHAFRLAGADCERVHIGQLVRRRRRLEEFDILVLPGGFSYGDDLGAGTVLANQIQNRLAGDLQAFVDSGKPVIGICNGFQVLVRLGILPGWDGMKCASLIENTSAKFEDRWVHLRVESTVSPFLRFAAGRAPGEAPCVVRFPIAHREGRFFVRDPDLVERLRESGQIALTYCRGPEGERAEGRYPANPNGSIHDIAGICNPAGNVLGLMPHPERFIHRMQDPRWTRAGSAVRSMETSELERGGDGYQLFESAVHFALERQRSAAG